MAAAERSGVRAPARQKRHVGCLRSLLTSGSLLSLVLSFGNAALLEAAFVHPSYAFLSDCSNSAKLTSSEALPAHTCTSKLTSTTGSISSKRDMSLACQLLGMNCRKGLAFNLHWPSFCDRGGGSDVHADGWGLAYYYQGKHGLRQFHDVEAASTSALAQFLGQQSIQTSNMMAHIRYATSGSVDLANVHPFSREMWGLNFAFCHNGHVPLMIDHPDYQLGGSGGSSERFYSPVGTTDSEALFCAMLNALRAQFVDSMPSLPVLHDSLRKLAQEAVDYDPPGTILNFLLTSGPHVLWVYSWPGSRPGSDVWNGLHYMVVQNHTSSAKSLADDDYSLDVSTDESVFLSNGTEHSRNHRPRVNGGGAASTVAPGSTFETTATTTDDENPCCIVATKPLTDEADVWIELKPGELILFDGGLPHVSVKELFKVELQGHGLDNEGRATIKPPRLAEDMRRYEFQPEYFAAGGI